MTAHRHHLVLVDRGAQHRHRWASKCDCGCGWAGIPRRRKREAVGQFRAMASDADLQRQLVAGTRRPGPEPMVCRQVTPADRLPEALR